MANHDHSSTVADNARKPANADGSTSKLPKQIKVAIDFLELPGKVVGYGAAVYTLLGFALYPFLGRWPIWLLWTAWSLIAVIGLSVAVFGFLKWPRKRQWLSIVVILVTGVLATALFLLIPDRPSWTQPDVTELAQQRQPLPPPLNIIEPIAWGREFPGGTTFQTKVQGWRAPGSYGQWVMYVSNKLSPNRLPTAIALRDEAIEAVIGAYVFADWRIQRTVGFDGQHKRLVLDADMPPGNEYYVVVFAFPLSAAAFDSLQENPDEVLAF